MQKDMENQYDLAAGTAPTPATLKAGCGIRFDPEALGAETGFDFSGANALKPQEDEGKETEAASTASAKEGARPPVTD